MSDLIRREDVLAYLEENTNDFPDYHEAIEQVLKMPNANKTELEEIKAEITTQGNLECDLELTSTCKNCKTNSYNSFLQILDNHINQVDCDNDCEHCEWTECPKE